MAEEYQCRRCLKNKDASEFYARKDALRPVRSHCKACIKLHRQSRLPEERAYRREHRRQNLDKMRKYGRERYKTNGGRGYRTKEAKRAHKAVEMAIKSGKLVRPSNCERCGSGEHEIEAHHADYSKPLDVLWVCTLCHGKEHWK